MATDYNALTEQQLAKRHLKAKADTYTMAALAVFCLAVFILALVVSVVQTW